MGERGSHACGGKDAQISSKRKAIDMKVASHMIRGARNRKNGQKRGCVRLENERCGGSGNRDRPLGAVASENSKQVYKRTGGEVSVFA